MVDGVKIGIIKIPAIKGEQGEKGEAGKIIELRIQMLDPLSNPTITNSGTETDAILEFGIPKGDSIKSADINENGNLIITLESERQIDAGNTKGLGIKNAELKNGEIIITLTDESIINAGKIYDDEFCKQKIEEYNQNARDVTLQSLDSIEKKKEIIFTELDTIKNNYEKLLQEYEIKFSNMMDKITELETKIDNEETNREQAETDRVTSENQRKEDELEREKQFEILTNEVEELLEKLKNNGIITEMINAISTSNGITDIRTDKSIEISGKNLEIEEISNNDIDTLFIN